MLAAISSLKQTIDENRLFHQGSSNEITEEILWRLKAVEDFKRGLTGVLNHSGITQ